MVRSKAEMRAYDEGWKKENSVKYQLRVTRSSGIPDAIKSAIENTGITEPQFIRQAIEEKLTREGYLNKPEI